MTDPASAPDFQKILAETVHQDPGLTPEEQTRFINRYSVAALIWQFVYYGAMGDWLLAGLSIACSVIFIFAPLLLIFPIWARRRAYRLRSWANFGHFYAAQKKWDRSAVWLLIISLLLLVISFWLIGPTLIDAFKAINGTNSSTGSFSNQVQDTIQQYQNVLGQ